MTKNKIINQHHIIMSKINKIEEVSNRSRFDAIVKFDSRTIVKSGKMNLAEIRIKGRTRFFHVIEKCSHERVVKLVRAYVKSQNYERRMSAAEESLLLAA